MILKNTSRGFALPVIMLVSLSLMIVALSMLQNASSLRNSIDDQYYNRLAEEAAQSGITYAVDCLSNNGYTQTWTAPLTQNQNCDSTPAVTAVTDITPQPDMISTFSVDNVEGRSDGALLVTSTGVTKRVISGTSTVVKTYTAKVKRIASSAYIKFSGVTFGYYFYSYTGPNSTGVYYFVKGSDGKLRSAGGNYYGQLGTGNFSDVITPQVVSVPDGKTPVAAYTNFLSQGWNSFITTSDGTVFGAGDGESGQLGNGSTDRYNSTLQKFNLPDGKKGVYVGLLGYATFVFTDDHYIYSAGDCTAGQLGYDCGGSANQLVPRKVEGLPEPNDADPNTIPEQDFIADSHTSYIRMKGGQVYGWGGNSDGQLGDNTYNDSLQAKRIGNFGDAGQPKAVQIAFDGISFYILDSNGSVWATGNNYWGQLGIGSGTGKVNSLRKIPYPSSQGKFVQISTDQWFVTLRTSTGEVWGAGLNDAGQLGNNQTNYRERSLVKFILPTNIKATYMYNSSIGDGNDGNLDNTFVIGNNGKVYGAGGNLYGQLGDGTTNAASKPVEMKTFDGRRIRAKSVTYGYGTTVILSNKNTYYTVGNNSNGQLGNGTTQNSSTPREAKFLQPASGSFLF